MWPPSDPRAIGRVFAGMTSLLASGVVRRVSFEVSRDLMLDDWEPFSRRLADLEHRGWRFATISAAGDPEPVDLATIAERGRFSQVLMRLADDV